MIPALLAALLFGAAFPLCQALGKDWGRMPLAGMLYLSSGVGLLAALPLIRAGERLRREDLKWLAPAIFFGGIAAPIASMYGLLFTTGAAGALLMNLEAVFTALIAVLFFREALKRREWIAMGVIVAGATLVGWATSQQSAASQPILGGLLVALATLCWGIDNNFTKRIADRDPIQIACVKGLVAGPVSLLLGMAAGQNVPRDAMVLVLTALVGFGSFGVSLVLFVLALRKLGAAMTSALFAASAVSGVGVGWLVGETVGFWTIVGGAVIVAGVVWLARSSASARGEAART